MSLKAQLTTLFFEDRAPNEFNDQTHEIATEAAVSQCFSPY